MGIDVFGFGVGGAMAFTVVMMLLTFVNVLFITVMVKHIINHYNFYKWLALFVFLLSTLLLGVSFGSFAELITNSLSSQQ